MTRPPELKSHCFMESPSGGKQQVRGHTGWQRRSVRLPQRAEVSGTVFQIRSSRNVPLEYRRKTNLLDHDDFSRSAGRVSSETFVAFPLALCSEEFGLQSSSEAAKRKEIKSFKSRSWCSGVGEKGRQQLLNMNHKRSG